MGSIFLKDWFDKGVTFVLDLLKKDGNFYSYSEFTAIFELDTSPKICDWVIKSISPKLLYLVRAYRSYIVAKCKVPKLSIGGLELCNVKYNNFWMRRILIKKFSCHTKAFFKWKINYPYLSTIIWSGIKTLLLPNKMKELYYKILHFFIITIHVTLFFLNLNWTFLHNAHPVILILKQYHIYFLNVIMQMIFGKK